MNKDLGFELRSLANRVERLQNYFLKRNGCGEYSVTQCGIFGHIRNYSGDIFPKDLEKTLCIRSSSITGIIDRMEKKGLLARVPVKHDGRMKKIVITPGKETSMDEPSKAILDVEANLVKEIPPEEIEQFYATLNKLIAAIDKMEEEMD